MSCKYCQRQWVETDGGEVLVDTCTNEFCFEYQTDLLNIENCNEAGCPHFENKIKEVENEESARAV